MQHVAIDLGGRQSQVCIRDRDGSIVAEHRWPTSSLADRLQQMPSSRVIVETCAEAFAVADAARAAGHQVRVVPATLVRALGVGSRRTKTDRRDAQILSEASCRMDLPSVHIPAARARERKALCTMREALVEARTKLINTVRSFLRTRAERLRTGAAETFAERFAESAPDAPAYVQRVVASIAELTEQIRQADAELAEHAKEDATCRRLMTAPGVGPVTAVRFVAAVDDVTRFAGSHPLASYLGLVPGEDSSGDRRRRTSITKAGPRKLRWTLVQAAWTARRCRRADPMVLWSAEVEKRRGKRIAVVALARKLAGVLYAMWRDGTTYSAERAATARPPAPHHYRIERQRQEGATP